MQKNNEKCYHLSENEARTYHGKVKKGSERKDKKMGNRKNRWQKEFRQKGNCWENAYERH